MPRPIACDCTNLQSNRTMKFDDHALCFPCHGDWLYGVLSLPEAPRQRGVLLIVGGPQYRAGSHRQFTLLARYWAAQGIPVFRFDYRGMGDSEGNKRTFEEVSDDVRHAIDQFMAAVPGLQEIVLWGLCDAASAAVFYAYQDRRVAGLVLLNPWVRTEQGAAKAYLQHYYLGRLFEKDLWQKILTGRFHYRAALRSFLNLVGTVVVQKEKAVTGEPDDKPVFRTMSLPERMLDGLRQFEGQVLLILSGNDLTAKEFSDLVATSRKWREIVKSPRVQRFELPDANHTFSRRAWRDQVAVLTKDWIHAW